MVLKRQLAGSPVHASEQRAGAELVEIEVSLGTSQAFHPWAKGMISTRALEGGPNVEHAEMERLQLQEVTDEKSGRRFRFCKCPGLIVVGAGSVKEIPAASRAIDHIRSIPRDKGAVILPRGTVVQMSQDDAHTLGYKGVIVVNSEFEDLQEGVLAYAQQFLSRQRAGMVNLQDFMLGSRDATRTGTPSDE